MNKLIESNNGYGHRWRQLRLLVLARDNYLCQQCKREGRITPGNQADHIIPKSQGGQDEIDNLQTLCTECHMDKTIRESGRVPRETYTVDGYPINHNHHWNNKR